MDIFEWLLLVLMLEYFKYFLVYLLVKIQQLVHKISSFPDILYKRGVHKNFSKFTDKNKKQSSTGILSKDILKKFTGKHLCWSLFFIKLQFWRPATFLRKTPTQMLSCEICEIFKNSYFEKHLWKAASKLYWKRDSNTVVDEGMINLENEFTRLFNAAKL